MILDDFLQVSSYGLQTALIVSAPVLIFGLLAGIAISIFQAATQINDAALAFLPKILATIAALVLFGPWMISEMVTFTEFSFQQILSVGQ